MAQATAATGRATAAVGGRTTGGLVGAMSGPAGIAAAAALATGVVAKLAFDFDDAFTKIAAVTNTSQSQIAKWREQVLALAGETAQAPQELAEGLYFLASAGLDTADVMPTLEASAKAAAVGLGEMGDVTRIVANVMNAFPEAGLKATDVLDTLVAAVREGTAEPNEFADAMGRILPIASKAEVSFDEVAASLATLSNIGLDVNEGVTAMRGLLNAIVAPGTQAADAIKSVGLTSDGLRRSLAEDGLIATLRLLEEATGGDIEVMRKIVPNIRAMTGAFGLTGQEAEKVDGIFDAVASSTGSLNEAFGKTEKGEAFQMRQALAELTAVGVELGEEVLPTIVDAISAIADVAGPTVDAIDDILGGLIDLAKFQLPGSSEAAEEFTDQVWSLREALATGDATVQQANRVVRAFGESGFYSAYQIGQLEAAVNNGARDMQLAGLAAAGYSGNLGDLQGAAEEVTTATAHHGDAQDDLNAEMDEGIDLAKALRDALDGLAGSQIRAEDATITWEQSLDDMFAELRDGKKTLDITTQAGRDNRKAILDAAEAAIDLGAAVAEETGSVRRGKQVVREHIEALIDQAAKAGISEEAIRDYLRELNLTPEQIETLIRLRTDEAHNKAVAFKSLLDSIPDIKDVLVRFRASGNVPGGAIGHAGGTIGALHARRMHAGGELRGDEEWFIGQRGERVLSVAKMQTLRSILGMAPASATSEPAQPRQPTTINVFVGEKKIDEIFLDAAGRQISRLVGI